jgi:hypothetical protein
MSIISLKEISFALCLLMVFFDLPANYHLDPESLLTKSCTRVPS